MTSVSFIHYAIFTVIVLGLLALDLFVFHRDTKTISIKSSLGFSLFWISLSLAFGAWIWIEWGSSYATDFFTGYILEYSLSMDNVFVIAMIFSYFSVPEKYRHRVLFWGIIGAILMRGIMIAIGAKAVAEYHWILYVFGVFLIYTGMKMLFSKHEDEKSLSENKLLKLCKKVFPISKNIHGEHFTVKKHGKVFLTPLALALIMVEVTDLIFAVDSIPAIFVVTQEPFIVFTSNICAILGLRSLFFLLSRMVTLFKYLHIGLSFVLILIGIKMLIGYWDIHVPTLYFLFLILFILGGSIAASIISNKKNPAK